MAFCGFGIEATLALLNVFSCLYISLLWKSLRIIGICSFRHGSIWLYPYSLGFSFYTAPSHSRSAYMLLI